MDVSKELKLYIDSKEHMGACLLTGKWGCGKTHLINKLKKEIDSKEKCMLIVSLFGIDSIESLNKAIKGKILDLMLGDKEENDGFNKQKSLKRLLSAFSIFSDKVASVKANLSITVYEMIQVEKYITYLENCEKVSKEIILVFDDFERSKLDIVELLGMINEYCENKRIKTIIVADETKISEDVHSKEDYLSFKEKVIQTTYTFEPNYYEVIKNIVLNYKETNKGYNQFLKNNIDLLYQVFIESESNNLRTVKAILIGFERIYNICSSLSNGFGHTSDLLYSYSVLLFEYRNGNFKKGAYGYLMADSKFYTKYISYGSSLMSLKIYVGSHIWDEESFVSEMKSKYEVKNTTYAQQFLMSNIWGMNDEIIEKGLTECLKLAYEGNLYLDDYISILNKLVFLRNCDYQLPCIIDYNKMMEGLKKKKDRILNNKCNDEHNTTFILNDQLRILGEDAVELNNHIENFYSEIEICRYRQRVIDELKGDCNFIDLSNMNSKCFDKEFKKVLLEAYINNDNYNRTKIINWFNSVDFDKEDIERSKEDLISLHRDLESLESKESDQFTKLIHRQFVNAVIYKYKHISLDYNN